MHQALYRKYRPQTFSDVCGQDHISNTLKTQVEQNRFTHAYLFTGSRGTGKTSSAKILAKAVNCLNNIGGDPCNECEVCKTIDNGTNLDIVEIDAASNRKIENIRDLQEQIEYSPTNSKYRVYIIDEVHMLTKEAFNALLKTLEEPPAHAIFILATTEVWAIPPTILSRCQRYDFNRIPIDIIVARLKYVCGQENLKIEDDAATLIAKLADGGMRDSLSMLDLCAGTSSEITEKAVAECVGLVGKEHLFDFIDFIEKKDSAGALELLDKLYSASLDIERLFTELIAHYRDLLVAKTSKDYARLITGTAENIEKIFNQAKTIRFEDIMYNSSCLSESLEAMKGGNSKRICAETTLIKLCTDKTSTSLEAIVKRLGALEDAVAYGNVNIQPQTDTEQVSEQKVQPKPFEQPAKAQPVQAESIAQQPAKADEQPKTERFTKWVEVKELIEKESSPLYSVLDSSRAFISGNRVLIDAPNPMFLNLIRDNQYYKEVIRKAVLQITGKNYGLGPYKEKEQTPVANDALDEFMNNFADDITIE